jgi:hypothetical protein
VLDVYCYVAAVALCYNCLYFAFELVVGLRCMVEDE